MNKSAQSDAMYLLDTHAFFWFITDDAKLPQKAREIIETYEHLYMSIGSFWEMAIKSSIGKLELPASISQLMEECHEMGITILPIEAAHLERLSRLHRIHGDPFDRLIVCQAQEEHLIIVTTDENIVRYEVKTCWR